MGLGGGAGPWGAVPAQAAPAAPPPPPPADPVWHLAANGQTTGPFPVAELARMVAAGTLTRDTHVWTTGQDGWLRAGDVPALARLFAAVPPPPPPG
jgi:hypothetical protein